MNMKPDSTIQKEKPALFQFAFIREFGNVLSEIAAMAIPEKWDYSNQKNVRPLPILFNYILHTFTKVQDENKVLQKDNYFCFNTGLVTPNFEEIFMLFSENNEGWRSFVRLCKESDTVLNRFSPLPERASYFSDPSELIYDNRLDLRVNIDHIVDDPNNYDRFPEALKCLPKLQLVNTFFGAIEHAKKRIKRNYLTAVPQYYRSTLFPSGQLQLLLPLCLIEPTKANLALAVYKSDTSYMGRTCLSLDMAINNARLITKPDDEWLRP